MKTKSNGKEKYLFDLLTPSELQELLAAKSDIDLMYMFKREYSAAGINLRSRNGRLEYFQKSNGSHVEVSPGYARDMLLYYKLFLDKGDWHEGRVAKPRLEEPAAKSNGKGKYLFDLLKPRELKELLETRADPDIDVMFAREYSDVGIDLKYRNGRLEYFKESNGSPVRISPERARDTLYAYKVYLLSQDKEDWHSLEEAAEMAKLLPKHMRQIAEKRFGWVYSKAPTEDFYAKEGEIPRPDLEELAAQ